MLVLTRMRKYLQRWIAWFKNDPDFPDKCDICGLRDRYSGQATDNAILKAGKLEPYGITKSYRRNIHAELGDSDSEEFTFFCALSNNKYWNRKFRKCPDWQLQIGGRLTLSDYITIHHSRHNTRIAIWLAIFAFILTTTVIIISLKKVQNAHTHKKSRRKH